MTRRPFVALAMLVSFVFGLSVSVSAQQPTQKTGSKIDQTKFAGVIRTGKAIQAATKVGVNKIRFSQLLQEFATEMEIAKDVVATPEEKAAFKQYETALASYVYSVSCCWTVDSGSRGELFVKILRMCSHEMENAHRQVRGLKPLPLPEELKIESPK